MGNTIYYVIENRASIYELEAGALGELNFHAWLIK